MRANYTILFLFLFPLFLEAQKTPNLDLHLVHNWNLKGRDIELSVDKRIKDVVIHLGINYHQNDALLIQRSHVLKNRANTFIERWGFTFGSKNFIQFSFSNIEFYPKIEIQVMKTSQAVRNTAYLGTTPFTHIRKLEPAISLNNTLGLDAKIKLYKNVFLVGSAEGGILLRADKDNISFSRFGIFAWDLTYNFSAGLAYRLFE